MQQNETLNTFSRATEAKSGKGGKEFSMFYMNNFVIVNRANFHYTEGSFNATQRKRNNNISIINLFRSCKLDLKMLIEKLVESVSLPLQYPSVVSLVDWRGV